MSYKSSLLKLAIKWTPKSLIAWVANIVLKDIAEVNELSFDLDDRKAYVQIQLAGEAETIDVWLEDFAVLKEGESYQFFIQQAQSNRLWLTNLLARVAGKTWKIPVPAKMASYIDLITELFESEQASVEDQVATESDSPEKTPSEED